MANGRGTRKNGSGRVEGPFVALPWDVLDSAAYARLGYPARALLLEVARQYIRGNNGRLLTSRAHLASRGWKSVDVISRAVRELETASLIHQTVQGHRPNKASWWAVTWQRLDLHPAFDSGAAATFKRGAYRETEPLKNASLRPSAGLERPAIAPPDGLESGAPVPSGGTVRPGFEGLPRPSGGHHLENHLPVASTALMGRPGVNSHVAELDRIRVISIDPKSGPDIGSPPGSDSKGSRDPPRKKGLDEVLREIRGRSNGDANPASLTDDTDDRRRCTDCAGYAGRYCPRPAISGIQEPGTLAQIRQRCPGFNPRKGTSP